MKFIRANGDAADPNPVLPDIVIKQSPNSLKDEVLEFAKEWVGRNEGIVLTFSIL